MLTHLFRRAVTLLTLLVASLFTGISMAYAAENPLDGADAPATDWFNLDDATNVVRLIGFLLPVATALLTKSNASSGLKAVVNLVLVTLTATVATLVGDSGGYAWQEFVNSFLNTFVPAIAMYYGLLKPTRITDAVNVKTGSFGFGPKPEARVDTTLPRSTTEDGAADVLYILGVLLLVVGIGALVLTLLGVASVPHLASIIIAAIGLVLVMLSRRGAAL